MSQGPTHCSRTKHIDFTLALARDYIQRGRAIMEYCPTAEQIADMWKKQPGPGPLSFTEVVLWGLFLTCILRLVLSAIVSSR